VTAFICKTCGETIEGSPLTHYRDAHPGEKSPAPSHKAKKPKTEWVDKVEERSGGSQPGSAEPGVDPPADSGTAEPAPDFGDDAIVPEIVAPRRSWKDRLWGTGPKPPKTPHVLRGTSLARPGKRENASELLGSGWRGLGFLVAKADGPVGRCMQYQAPVAGEVFDDLLAGTFIDRGLVQPIARNTETAKAASAVLALPALIYMYERAAPELQVVLAGFLEQAALAHIEAMVPVMKKKQARDRAMAKVIDDLKAEGMMDPNAATATDAATAVLEQIFGQPAEPDPANNGTHATAPVG